MELSVTDNRSPITDHSSDFVETLEIEYSGINGRIRELLRWGGAIMHELDVYMLRRAEIEGQLESLTGQILNSGVTLDSVTKQHIMDALASCNGNKSQAARILGIPRRALLRRVDKYDLPKEVPTKHRKFLELTNG